MANIQSSHIRFFYRTRESSLASHLFEFIRLYLYALYGFIHYLCPNAIVWLSTVGDEEAACQTCSPFARFS